MSQDPYVKLHFSYYDDVVLATLGDDAEVMFTRGLSYCGRASSNGFIPIAKLLGLCRKTTQPAAVKLANSLCGSISDHDGPWVKVAGGYKVRNWERYQHELMTLQAKLKTDADRQRRKRERDRMSRESSRDMSRDSPTDVTHTSKSESVNAAAAASAAGGDGLTADVRVFRDKLRAVPAFKDMSFEVDQVHLDAIHDLVVLHGDEPLIATALRTSFHPVPTFVSAFLKKWRAMAPPGSLQLVEAERCPNCSLTLSACAKADPNRPADARCNRATA